MARTIASERGIANSRSKVSSRFASRNMPYSLEFNGDTSYVSIAATTDTEDLFDEGGTLEFWCYPRTYGEAASGKIITTNSWNFGFLTPNLVRFFHAFDGGTSGSWRTSSLSQFRKERWTHVIITYNNSDVANDPSIYVNNMYGTSFVPTTLTEIGTPTGTRTSDAGTAQVIGNNGATTNAWDGYISLIRYYKGKEFTAAEVANAFYGDVIPSTRAEEWAFTDGSGTTLTALNGSNGTISNCNWTTQSPFNSRTVI